MTPGPLGEGIEYYNRGSIKTDFSPSEPVLFDPRNNESCTVPTGREEQYGNPYRSGTLPSYPRKSGGGIDVDRCLEMVRAGYSGELEPWALPGTGQPGDKCGYLIGTVMHCDDCGHRWPKLMSCRGMVCPRCGGTQVRQNAMAAAIKLRAVGATRVADGLRLRRLMVSPPPDRWAAVFSKYGGARHSMDGLRRTATDLAREVGMCGGARVFHPGRDGEVRWHFTERGPHFHFTGWSTWLRSWTKSDVVRTGGWVVAIRPEHYKPGPAVYNVLAYDLTHVGVWPSLPTVTWWGIAHHKKNPLPEPVKALVAAIREGHRSVCPRCTSINTRKSVATWDELMEWGFPEPPSHERPPRPPTQHRFIEVDRCADCGTVWTEPVPKATVPATRPIERPRAYREPRRRSRP